MAGCQVSGPLGDVCLESVCDHIRDLRLCSQSLNKLDQHALQQSWRRRLEPMHVFSRNSKCMLSITAASQWTLSGSSISLWIMDTFLKTFVCNYCLIVACVLSLCIFYCNYLYGHVYLFILVSQTHFIIFSLSANCLYCWLFANCKKLWVWYGQGILLYVAWCLWTNKY